ncbi:MAG: V-type ATP synthase subunit F [Caldisphaeraceae archaeon]|nr:V-type ATP synthase subunit F [Caldisphaeraceae archaeon]
MAFEGKIYVIADRINANLFRIAGIPTLEANKQEDVIEQMKVAESKGASLVVVLKHLVDDNNKIRGFARSIGLTLLIIPTKLANMEPIDVDKLLAKALGIG